MKKWSTAVFFASAASGAASLHAETTEVPSSMLEQHAGTWQGMLDSPLGLAAAVFAAVMLVALVVALYKRSSGAREPHRFEHTYAGGYDTITPVTPVRKEPGLRPIALKAVSDKKTDTVIVPWSVPADFDVPRFLRKSKAAFIRLQASWDQADLKDIRRFTTRELFGEFCQQLKQRGGAPNVTEVVTLGAELQGVETAGDYYIATVKFTGMIKEDAQAEVAPFSETWNLSKPLDGHRSWVVAGISQA